MGEDLLGATAPLPRGPHQLPREQVAASQRERLLVAFTELLAENGYAGVTIGELARRACLMAAYDRFATKLLAAVTAAPEDAGFQKFVSAAIEGYLGTLEREPVAARAFLVEMDGAGPAARQRRRESPHLFAALISHRHNLIRKRQPELGPLPERVFLGLAMGVRELAREMLEDEPEPKLTRLTDDVMTWVVAMIEGAKS